MSYPDDILEEEKVSIVGDSSHLRHQNAGLEEKQVTFSGPSTTVCHRPPALNEFKFQLMKMMLK